MLVANSSFDLWQKDAFFSAAEEVQQSADIMESMYRLWLRGTKEQQSNSPRELQIALGTAKWQLDEFVKAVRFGCHRQDNIANRHKQFIDAMEDQISRVEKALIAQEEHAFRWVRLDDEETTDLHRFLLSGTPTTATWQITDANREIDVSDCINGDQEFVSNTVQQEAKCSAKITAELDQRGAWKMVIVDEEDDKPRNTQEQSIELASKSSFWFLPKRKRNKFTKMFRRVVRQVHVTNYNQITRSFQVILLLMLFIFFLGMLFTLNA